MNKYIKPMAEHFNKTGFTEELTESNFVIPSQEDYIDFGEQTQEWDIAAEKPGLWENIRRKKNREGDKYRPAKPGDKDRPDPESWKRAQGDDDMFDNPKDAEKRAMEMGLKGHHTHKDKDGNTIYMPGPNHEAYLKAIKPKAHKAGPMEDYVFISKDAATKMAEKIGLDGVHKSITGDGKTLYIPGKTEQEFKKWYKEHKGIDAEGYGPAKPKRKSKSAKYQGRKVTLNKPFRTPDGPKKRSVYVKNDKGNVVKVNFGDPDMEIKRDDPARRKSFRARHKCDTNPGPKWKARYWSCKMW